VGESAQATTSRDESEDITPMIGDDPIVSRQESDGPASRICVD
jgi:hypothetical protein